jgi:N-acyl-D-amino-acid deacylase
VVHAQYDVLLRNGHVLDGTGNPWFKADVAVRDGRIAAVGKLRSATAARVIDAAGHVVVPGFIDLHSHADEGLGNNDARRRAAPNLVAQGVTTVVVNQDGRSPRPIREQRVAYDKLKIGPNAILLVGHGTVRSAVLGNDYRRAATAEETQRMKALVRQALADGAWGMSSGLEYGSTPWATTDEMVALAEELVPVDGVLIQHERSGGVAPMWWLPSRDPPGPPTLLDTIREGVEISERTGARVVISHIKSRGQKYWGTAGAAVQIIERARARGVEVWADQYPYETSGSDGGLVLIPDWARRDLPKILADPGEAAKLRADITHQIDFRGGAERIIVFDYPEKSYVGKNLAELASQRGKSPVEMAITLRLEGYPNRPGGARVRSFSMDEPDIEQYAAQPWVATASDAGIALPEDGPATHARFYGTFPRKIRRYAMERKVLTVEQAIRSMTSLPAQILGLRDRGLLREGLAADLAVLKLDEVRDRATFTDPHQYAAGVPYVLVGGKFVVDGGKLTGELPGRVITRHLYLGARPE